RGGPRPAAAPRAGARPAGEARARGDRARHDQDRPARAGLFRPPCHPGEGDGQGEDPPRRRRRRRGHGGQARRHRGGSVRRQGGGRGSFPGVPRSAHDHPLSVPGRVTMESTRGRFFEDFERGAVLRHATPRTITEGDAALYTALTGDRRPLHCAATVARAMGYPRESIHDLLVFHIVFGKTVADVSQNAVANLGYADVRFLRPVFPGDTLRAESEVLGSRETSSGKSGIVWVRTRGLNQHDEEVLRYCRWVMVEKRGAAPTGANDAPVLPQEVPAADLRPPALDPTRLPDWATGGRAQFEDYEVGQRIHHVDGMTVEESDHMLATRLYQNTARVHFNQHQMSASR